MGPPSEDGGNGGAAPAMRAAALRLQWGRRPRTAEMITGAVASTASAISFNGAAVRGRRKSRQCVITEKIDGTLQWGRRPRTAEIRTEGTIMAVPGELQWGRRPRTAEIVQQTVRHQRRNNASMGPPSEDGGNQPAARHRNRERAASMGPPSEDGGNFSTGRR